MVLLLPGGQPLQQGGDGTLLEQLLASPALQLASTDFLAASGEQPVPATSRAVCTLMGEQALVDTASTDWHIGSMDATTCLIAVALCRACNKAWTAHYNSSLARSDPAPMQLLPHCMTAPDLYLVGSFVEDSGESEATLDRVLHDFHASPLPFVLRLACVDRVNTAPGGGPIALHLSVCCSSGRASPAGFSDRGPELPRRFAHDYLAAGRRAPGMRHIVHTAAGRLVIPGCWVRPRSQGEASWYARKVALPDPEFLASNSTSPDYEPPNFVGDIKGAYRYLLHVVAQGWTQIPDAVFEWVQEGGVQGVQGGSGRWVPADEALGAAAAAAARGVGTRAHNGNGDASGDSGGSGRGAAAAEGAGEAGGDLRKVAVAAASNGVAGNGC